MKLNPVKLILPKGKGVKGGKSFTPTYNQRQPLLKAPTYREHLQDLYNSRLSSDSRDLLSAAVNQDPDVSAAVHAYLTIAGSADLVIYAFDDKAQLDMEGVKLGRALLDQLTTVSDYSVGYSAKPLLSSLCESIRYFMMLRGMVAAELVFDKQMVPSELRLVDPASLIWNEKTPGVFAPVQKPKGSQVEIDLNIPTFFTSRFHQNPTDIYTFSPFVSAINTIAARQEVINELYRIMRVVGYPRLDFEVLEEVLQQNAPVIIRNDPKKMREFVDGEIAKLTTALQTIRSDQALVHSSAVKARVINDKNPGAGMQIQQIIDVLDAQNQSALKVMPAVIGKADGGQVAGTEARLFALGADSMNRAVAGVLTQSLTLAARLAGYQGRIEARFRPVELRPELELEPQKVMKSSRLKQDLSAGLITDDEYHMEMYGRPAPEGAEQLSGTNFLTPNAGAANVDVTDISPNQDAHGRSLAPPGGKSAKSNASKPAAAPQTKTAKKE
ncbi:hypothetical protein [Sphingomonas jaspsi]|uniref:hypothetical protein n=1 Tax=Sphingomonas jaspsi TaxID=392409 RepID=UPI0004AE20E0|nr:hypothetical protein [Sphingomonas jaspsi]